MIEHTPDFISFINDCSEILKENGVIILAVPDAAHCFDYFRQITSISEIINANMYSNKIHTIGTAVDHVMNVCTMDDSITWNTISNGNFKFMHSLSEARLLLGQPVETQKYMDYHAWCFTPHSFRVLIEDLYNLGLISVREIAFIPTGGFEFFIVLGGKGEGPNQSRMQLMKKMKQEISQESTLVLRLYSRLVRLWKSIVMVA